MSSQAITVNTEAAILARLMQTDEHALTPEAARYWLSLQLPAADEARVDELSAKARDGALTADEQQELESYLHVGMLLGTMQSKARQVLQRFPDSAWP
jgi:hypothetical protein